MWHGRFTPEQGALLLKALDAAVDSEDHDVSAETPTLSLGQRRASALLDLAETYLANKETQRQGGDRYLVMVHVGTDDEVPYLDESGTEISAETSRRLSCDASVVPIKGPIKGPIKADTAGETLNIGRKSRSIPPAMRRALHLRDQGCRFPGCTHSKFLDGHHVQHWADGGSTSLNNLVSLCRLHHRLIHEGGYHLTVTNDGEFEFYTPLGEHMPQSPRLTPPNGPLNNPNLQHRVDQRRQTYWDGGNMDYDDAIGLLAAKDSDWWDE